MSICGRSYKGLFRMRGKTQPTQPWLKHLAGIEFTLSLVETIIAILSLVELLIVMDGQDLLVNTCERSILPWDSQHKNAPHCTVFVDMWIGEMFCVTVTWKPLNPTCVKVYTHGRINRFDFVIGNYEMYETYETQIGCKHLTDMQGLSHWSKR